MRWFSRCPHPASEPCWNRQARRMTAHVALRAPRLTVLTIQSGGERLADCVARPFHVLGQCSAAPANLCADSSPVRQEADGASRVVKKDPLASNGMTGNFFVHGRCGVQQLVAIVIEYQ